MRNLIEQQLRQTAASGARRLRGDFDLNPDLRGLIAPRRKLTPAAVLIPLVERKQGLTVLLTRRTDHLNDHAGQISFPGGRVEETDADPVATALRETEEEIGLARRFIDVIAELDVYETSTGFAITPVVGFVREGFTLELDDFEVSEVFEVPLDFIFDPANHQRQSLVWKGAERQFYVIPYGRHHIWGATAGMLVNLYRMVMNR